MVRLALIALSILLFVPQMWPQVANGSLCDLAIHLRTPDDREYDGSVHLELLSTGGSPIAATGTSNGTAEFQVPSGITYRVRISGEGIETSTEEFFIMGGTLIHTENVSVTLKKTSTTQSETAPGSGPTISVTEMNAPANARDQMKKGMDALAKGDMVKAEERFEKATAIYPQYARAYTAQGLIAVKSGNKSKAKALFSKATEVDSNFLPAYVDLARIDFQENNYTEAESLLRKVMVLNPTMTDAVALLASTEYMNKEYNKALADAQRVHTLPNHQQFAQVHLLAGKIFEIKNDPQQAIAEYQLFLKESPQSPQAAMVEREISQLQTEDH
ncbi:MAG TPA: tetratricopeptide repeat protein [Terriglobales bacterium]|nr:tetratricopeptide repeat protein [Terriglobales bacterium]